MICVLSLKSALLVLEGLLNKNANMILGRLYPLIEVYLLLQKADAFENSDHIPGDSNMSLHLDGYCSIAMILCNSRLNS